MPVYISVSIKHNCRTLVRSQIVEIENNKSFRDVYELAVDNAKQGTSWAPEEQVLLENPSNLLPTAALSNPQDDSTGDHTAG